ncbi:Secreted protein [Rhizoctonia solani]|uniref:Secreted protein n=1 Tax=Rhizoctonia solani TaxID=456999 RepID=A0A8H7M3F2_9AGAM|nr:Secreted protein [Rhizoctonia solani]
MMKFAAASLAFAALAVAQNDPSINSPASVVQCQPIQLSWTATKVPVYISIIPGGQPGAAPLYDFGVQEPNKKSLTWTVNQPAGTDVTFQIKDADGAVAYSAVLKGGLRLRPNSPQARLALHLQPKPLRPRPPRRYPSSWNLHLLRKRFTRPPATATSVPTPSSTNAPAANGALPIAQAGWTGLMGLLAALIVA